MMVIRSTAAASCVVALAAAFTWGTPAAAQNDSPLGGVWTLNRSQSEFPREVGFNVDWMPKPGDGQSSSSGGSGSGGGGGRGRRGGSGGSGGGGSAASPFPTSRRESSEDARLLQLLTDEVRNPLTRLMVVDTPGAVTMTNELGQSRTVHPDGRQETITIQGMLVNVTSRRDAGKLIVTYNAARDRDLRYTIAPSASRPAQLLVEIQFLEHGEGDKVHRVYDQGTGPETTTAPSPSSGSTAPPAGGGSMPASGKAGETFDSRPGAELRGLKVLGLLVEDLSATAIGCGLNHDALQNALAKRLTDAGFEVRRNSDEDTYLYANVMTTTTGSTCVSRYDAYLYTQATASLSYRDKPVLVQVSLMHRGGIGTSPATTHAASVVQGLENYVNVFITQIRDANK